jgi:hypothetical protein
MSVVKDLITENADGSVSFGDYELDTKAKKSDFEVRGDRYKVKTFRESTRLECNDALVYESEPGTAVHDFVRTEEGVSFRVECPQDCQVVLGLTDEATYRVVVDGRDTGMMGTGRGGKLVLSVEVGESGSTKIEVIRA